MRTDEDVTEITALETTKVAGVEKPANRAPFILFKSKAQADSDSSTKQCPTCDGSGKIRAGKVTCPDCDGSGNVPADFTKSDSSEADQIEELVTGSAAKSYCGDPDCQECVKAELVPLNVRTTIASGVTKAQLTAADRKKMPASSFAYVDPKGGKHLPIHDQAHVQAALGRFGQQDFSDADDPADAKQKAAGKIKAAAGKVGVDVDDDSDVAQAAKKSEAEKGEVQDALQGTNTPEVAASLDGSQSGVAGPATAGLKDAPSTVPATQTATSTSGVTAQIAGGESAYEIPAEQHLAAKSMVAATLIQAMEQVQEQREAAKAGGFLQVAGPSADQAAAPGSMPWESYDSATLDQVAGCLASCCNAIDAIATREQIEAISGDAGDQSDAWDLQDASSALEYAMGVVARLAYSEQAEGGAAKSEADPHYQAVEKAYRRLRASDEKALRGAHAALSNVLAEHDRAKGAAADAGQNEPTEGDKIQMELTKQELADTIAASTQEAVKAALDAERKADKKARKQAKKAEEQAAKNANNGGDITAQQLKDGVSSEQDADDIQVVQGKVDPKYANKSEGEQPQGDESTEVLKAMQDQLKAVTDTLGSLGEQVQKFAKRPRQGGPVLDGQARGTFPAAEARLSDVAKSDEDESSQLIKSLEQQFEDAKKSGNAIAVSDFGNRLTHARLMQAHEQGRI